MKEEKRSNSLRNEPIIGLNTRLVRYGHARLSELYVNHKYLCVLMFKSKSKLTFQKPSTIHFSFLVCLTPSSHKKCHNFWKANGTDLKFYIKFPSIWCWVLPTYGTGTVNTSYRSTIILFHRPSCNKRTYLTEKNQNKMWICRYL